MAHPLAGRNGKSAKARSSRSFCACLTLQGSMKGAEIAEQIGLSFTVIEKFLHVMKAQRLLAHKSAGR